MSISKDNIENYLKGSFITTPAVLAEKLQAVKAYVYDWDGVFNDGAKDENGTSPFSEVDSMGTNLLRFHHYRYTGEMPRVAVISGERNAAVRRFANRECFDAVYGGIKHKVDALQHFCEQYDLKPEEVAFVFDDVLDFSLAAACGVRVMVTRECSPMLAQYAISNGLVDYTTYTVGGEGAVRESTELMMGLIGGYDETITHRMQFSDLYKIYIKQRNEQTPRFYKTKDSEIVQDDSI